MTVLESYPIHRCVFRNDSYALKELLLDEEIKKRINEKDNHGNTPIHLALMLDRRNCIITLINNGCDVITRNNFRWNPTEEALMLGDIDIVEKITVAKVKDYIKKFVEVMEAWDKVLPTCYLKVKAKLKSPIPLFEMFGAKDTLEVIKKGKSLRINTTLAGIDNRGMFKFYKGSLSFLFKYDRCLGIYNLFLLDNKNKKYQQFFPSPPQWFINDILKTKYGVNALYKYFFDPRVFSIKIKKQRFLKKKKETIALETGKTFKTDRFKLKNLTLVIRKRDNEMIIGDYKSEIHTKVMKVDYVMDKKKYLDEGISNAHDFTAALKDKHFVEGGEEEYDTADEEESDDESENENDKDDAFIENNETPDQRRKRKNVGKVEHSVFEEIVNENTVVDGKISLELTQKLFKILNDGQDEKGNKVTPYDLAYVDQFMPNYFSNVIKRKLSTNKTSERFNYLKYLTSNNKKGIKGQISKDGTTEYYEMKDNINESLDWETSYYNRINRQLKEKKTNEIKNTLNKREKLTEENYFDPSQTEDMHIGRIMNINEERKVFDNFVSLWLSKKNEFPISLSQFKPIIDFIVSMIFDLINVKEEDVNFDRNMINKTFSDSAKILQSDKRFPIKLSFPFYPTIRLVLKVLNCYIEEEKISDSLFEIPSNYSYSDEPFFKNVKLNSN